MAIFPGSAIPSAVSDYEIDNSLRFDDGDSAYLSRTPGSAGNRKTWTYSAWVKRGNLGTYGAIFGAWNDSSNQNELVFRGSSTDNYLSAEVYQSGGWVAKAHTEMVFHDPAAWYHVMWVWDTTQATAADRSIIYVNGERQDIRSGTLVSPAQDTQSVINDTYSHLIGQQGDSSQWNDGYLAELYFIDGTALTPSSFGELDSTTNQWKPLDSDDVKDAVTFGTNGFFQKYNSTELAASFADAVKYTVTSFTTVESTTWTAPTGVTSVEYLVVAGGGAGGSGYAPSGGGGAGGYRAGTLSVTPGSSYTVTVGAGGTGADGSSTTGPGPDGDDSVFSSITSTGGGGGGGNGGAYDGRPGGSGGGGYYGDNDGDQNGAGNTPSTSPVQGYAGGIGGISTNSSWSAGGGGGASEVGEAAERSYSSADGGDGGDGVANSITGSSVTYAGGGGGACDETGGAAGTGGSGGGGAGSRKNSSAAVSGTANTGGGGGGASWSSGSGNTVAGSGGSGIVVIKYLDASGTVSGHTITANGDATNQRPQHHDVTATGDAHLIGPKYGTSSIFFGSTNSNDGLSVASSTDWEWGTGDFTVEYWGYCRNLGNHNLGIILDNVSTTGHWQLAIEANGKPSWNHSGGGAELTSSVTINADTWYHLACVRSSSVTKLYLDGVEVASAADTTDYPTDKLYIGTDDTASTYYGQDGYQQNIRLSNTARYTSDFTPPTSAFVNDSNTKLLIQDGTDGSQTFTDGSSGSHTITVLNNTRWFAPKVGAGAMAFDGSDHFLVTGDRIGSGDWTVEFWFQKNDSTTSKYFWDMRNSSFPHGGSPAAPYLYFDANSSAIIGLNCGMSDGSSTSIASLSISNNAWHHIATTRSGSTYTVWVDGASVHTATDSAAVSGSEEWYIGERYSDADGFAGYMDGFRISSVARYTGTFTPPTTAFTDDINTNLILNADLNQGTWNPDTSTGLAISTDSRMKFDGTGDYLNIPNSTDWQFSGQFTIEGWVKKPDMATVGDIFTIYGGGGGGGNAGFQIFVGGNSSGEGVNCYFSSDGSAWTNVQEDYTWANATWYHLAVTRDGSNVVHIWVDGAEVGSGTSFTGTVADPAAYDTLSFGARTDTSSNQWDGYMDEIRISDTARYTGTFTPQTRGNPFEADSNTKLLIHSDYTGGLGADSSGNYNNFTATNLVATDQMIDTPNNNFATLNPILYSSEAYRFAEGNLEFTNPSGSYVGTSTWWKALSTIPMTSGKWYFEYLAEANGGSPILTYGIVPNTIPDTDPNMFGQYVGQKTAEWGYHSAGGKVVTGGVDTTAGYDTYAVGDIMSCALDLDNNKVYWAKNNTWQNSGDPTSGSTGTGAQTVATAGVSSWMFGVTTHEANGMVNFGADSSFAGNKTAQGNQDGNDKGDFYYEPPSGFLALCTDNLSDPEIKLPGENFNTVLYTGNGSTQSITGAGFQPDFTWIKNRNNGGSQIAWDSVREATNYIFPSSTSTESDGSGATSNLTSFDSDGFSVIYRSSNVNEVNRDTYTYASWNWKAGGAPTATNSGGQTPTSGSVMIDGSASTASLASADIYPEKMSINTTSGFSIISYEGNGSSSQTIPHGLSTAPALIISKGYSTGADYNWRVFGENVGLTSANYSMRLDLTNAENDNSNVFGTYPTSSVWTIGSDAGVNDSGKDYIVYCFSNIEGYSKAGSYEGNSNADGPFIYTGFKPAFVIIKGVDQAGSSWFLLDNKRDPYNVVNHELYADANSAESTGSRAIDFVSNGFKSRGNDALNYSSTMIYIAFAESPFKYSNAR